MPSVFTLSGSKPRRRGRKSRGLGSSLCPVPGTDPVSLRKTRMDRGGYVDGRYFGVGVPIYEASNQDGVAHVRASSRIDAKAQLRKMCPSIRFSR